MIDYIKRLASATDKQLRRVLPNAIPFYYFNDTKELGYKDDAGVLRRLGLSDASLVPGPQSGGAVSVVTILKKATLLADAVATDFDIPCVVSVPNANHAASLQIELQVSLGDQDSTQVSFFTIAISRIAGAAAKAVVSAISSNALTVGAAGNAAGLITVVVAGAVGAVNTINIKVTVTRSAGAATNHDAIARLAMFNLKAAGATIA